MAWQDRPYYRDRDSFAGNPLLWVLYGSVPLFTAFGIRVRAHAFLLLYMVLVLLLGVDQFHSWQDKVQSATLLFVVVLLHEFGHCFTARWVGGEADEILMHPLGGVALARPPHRPLATFLTVAGGPAVNVLICALCGVYLFAHWHALPLNPFHPWAPTSYHSSWQSLTPYVFWIYFTSLFLLAFNLMPIFPLDGGQLVQAALWPHLGHRRSMLVSCTIGMGASVIGAMIALATMNWWLAIMAAMGFIYCLNQRRQTIAEGLEEQFGDAIDYSAAYEQPARERPISRRRKRLSRRAIKRTRKLALAERMEQERVDAILAKVSAHGLQSLTWGERRTLRKATEHKRQRDLELKEF